MLMTNVIREGMMNMTIRQWQQGRTAQEMTRDALDRMAARGGADALNCVAETAPDAMTQAAGLDARADRAALPLFGVPVLVKDNIDAAGLHTTAGSLALTDNLVTADAPVVANLRRCGAVIVGKTNMTELANYTTQNMPNGYSSRGGQVIHAWDATLDPSGSSSGSGVAVSAGIVPLAVGTDTSFSIIACAQANGVCGIKPPVGVLPGTGIVPIARSLDSAGPMANTVGDALTMLSAMRDQPLPDIQPTGKLRIAVNTANAGRVSAEQRAYLDSVLARLKGCGAQIDVIEQPSTPLLGEIMRWEFGPHLADYLRASNAAVKSLAELVACYEAHPDTMMRYGITCLRAALDATPGGLASAHYAEIMAQRAALTAQTRAAIESYDAVLMTGGTNIMHCCGLPSATVAGTAERVPGCRRALVLYGADELRLYAAALAVEQIG